MSEVKGDLQVGPEAVGKLRVHVEHLKQIVPKDLVQVAVGQSPDVCARFARPTVQTDRLAEDIVFTWVGKKEKENTDKKIFNFGQRFLFRMKQASLLWANTRKN